MDTCKLSVETFDRLAERYAQKYLALDTYDVYYRQFCSHVSRQGATVLDLACGPGNVSAFLAREEEMKLIRHPSQE
jgi:ubiquinone/menaquinone biosynthesis C-methylase UbiE